MNEFKRFSRISVIADEKPLAMRLPYATINYETAGSVEKGKSPVVYFSVKNAVSMDEAMRSVEVTNILYLALIQSLTERFIIDCTMCAKFLCRSICFIADHCMVLQIGQGHY